MGVASAVAGVEWREVPASVRAVLALRGYVAAHVRVGGDASADVEVRVRELAEQSVRFLPAGSDPAFRQVWVDGVVRQVLGVMTQGSGAD